MKPFVDELSAVVQSFAESEQMLRSERLNWVMHSNGDADFHDNVIFFGLTAKQNEPVLVAKVPRRMENGWMLQREYDRLIELWDCMGADALDYIPRPLAMIPLQERSVLVLSYVSGESLTRLSPRSFWENSEQVSALAREAARSLRHLNQMTERPIQPGEDFDLHFGEKAEKFRELFQLSGEEDQALSVLEKKIQDRAATASHKVLIQGDFWHGNMIRAEKGGKLRFVDWQFACWSADVSMDVYFFLLAGALSATQTRSVQQHAREAFGLLNRWRTKLMPEYLSAYGTPEHYALLPQRDGMLMCCVEKAVRSALDFGYSHSDDFLWRHLFAELMNWPTEGEC